MQKLLSLLIVVLLMALPVCAEETAPAEEGGWLDAETGDAQAQVYMLQASFIWIFDLILLYALVLDP